MDVSEVRRAVFARHAHPVSAWSRLLTTPLVVAPLWSRRASVTALVSAWFVVNPVITPEPRTKKAFATRAILGEEQWLEDPDLDRTVTAVNAAGSLALFGAILAAWRRNRLLTVLGVGVSMVLTLVCWGRYADIYDTRGRKRRRKGRRRER